MSFLEPKEPKKAVKRTVKFSFTFTYILLITTATITFIESLRTPEPHVCHIMNLETAISVIAGYFYSIFVDKIKTAETSGVGLDFAEITVMRYSDWVITTPLMLIALCLVLSNNSKTRIHFATITSIIALNYFMLYSGFMGETGTWDRNTANFVGYIAFFAMFFVIFTAFVLPKYVVDNYLLFFFYLVIWSIYGIGYFFEPEMRNIVYCTLDAIAKCLLGLFLWVYYTKIIVK
jgi:bacteriorhodopsin